MHNQLKFLILLDHNQSTLFSNVLIFLLNCNSESIIIQNYVKETWKLQLICTKK